MKKYKYAFLYAFCLLAGIQATRAQGAGSVETDMGLSVISGGTTSTVSESLYIGPGTYQIDGTWEIYSKNLWISPDAAITGTGTIKFFNLSDAGGAASPTLLDGNNNAGYINVNLELHNAGNMVLTDDPAPGGSGWTDATGNANLTTGKDFLFSVANGNVLLGNYDIATATAGTLSGYQPDRFVVTNGTGHLVHNSYTGVFTYPIGITPGDYTPASINNTGAANTFHVMVQDYASSSAPEGGTSGIDRTWNIYADNNSGNASFDLQHNLSTDQTSYSNIAAFVTQYSAAAPNNSGQAPSQSAWQINTAGPGSSTGTLTTGTAISGASELSLVYTSFATTAADPLSFYSKSSDLTAPLPLQLVSFTATALQCKAQLNWQTANERSFDHFDIEYAADGNSYSKIGQVASQGNSLGGTYSFTYDQANNIGFYRLKIVDIGGAFVYSSIRTVQTSNCNSQGIVIYPNPTQGAVSVNGLNGGDLIQVYNAAGQLLISKRAVNSVETLNLGNFATGTYQVKVRNNTQDIMVTTIVKKK